jgi:allantoin racemase
MSKILWIDPVGTDLFDQPIKEFLETSKRPETVIDVISLKRGPMHLEYHYYEALILADTLHVVRQAELDGYDAAVIGCFYDPGLGEAREITENMIVTAPAEAAMHIATTLGHTFSILVGRKKWIPKMHENVVKYGFSDQLASFKSLDMGVYDFQKDPAKTAQMMRAAAREAVEVDGAEVIVLGCTIEFGFYKELQEELGVPVLDAVLAPFKYAEFLIELRKRFDWTHSKIYGYQSPPREEINQWGLEEQYGITGLWGENG